MSLRKEPLEITIFDTNNNPVLKGEMVSICMSADAEMSYVFDKISMFDANCCGWVPIPAEDYDCVTGYPL